MARKKAATSRLETVGDLLNAIDRVGCVEQRALTPDEVAAYTSTSVWVLPFLSYATNIGQPGLCKAAVQDVTRRLLASDARGTYRDPYQTPLSEAYATLNERGLWPDGRKSLASDGAISEPSKPPGARARRRPNELNGSMLDCIMRNPEARGWTAQKWATELHAQKSQIVEQPAWKALEEFRKAQIIQRQKDRRRGRVSK